MIYLNFHWGYLNLEKIKLIKLLQKKNTIIKWQIYQAFPAIFKVINCLILHFIVTICLLTLVKNQLSLALKKL